MTENIDENEHWTTFWTKFCARMQPPPAAMPRRRQEIVDMRKALFILAVALVVALPLSPIHAEEAAPESGFFDQLTGWVTALFQGSDQDEYGGMTGPGGLTAEGPEDTETDEYGGMTSPGG